MVKVLVKVVIKATIAIITRFAIFKCVQCGKVGYEGVVMVVVVVMLLVVIVLVGERRDLTKPL